MAFRGQRVFSWIVLCAFSLTGQMTGAKGRPRCDAKSLSRNCDFFKERKDQKEIVFPDGTRYPNPAWVEPAVVPLPLPVHLSATEQRIAKEEQRKMLEKRVEEMLDAQAEIMDILGDGHSPKFQLAISNPMGLAVLKSIIEDSTLSASASISLPWPPNASSSRQKMKTVSGPELRRDFYDKLSPEQKRKLTEVLGKFNPYGVYTGMGVGPSGGGGYGGGQGTGGTVGRLVPEVGTASRVSSESLNTSQASQDGVKRLENLVEETRSLLLSEIDKGRAYASLRPAEQAMYDKIKTVRFIPPTDPIVQASPDCAAGPNALYIPVNHSFFICPSMAQFPEISLVRTIAHELSHSIDPCLCEASVHQIDKNALQKRRSVEGHGNLELGAQVEEARGGGDMLSSAAHIFASAKENNLLRGEIAGGTPRKDYPYELTLKCLVQRIGLKHPDPALMEFEERQTQRARSARIGAPENEKTEGRRNLASNPDCVTSQVFGASETGEAMSDAFAAKTLGRYLEKNPGVIRNEADKISAFDLFFQGACSSTDLGFTEDAQSALQRSHPYDVERINEIFLADHRIQDAFGCASGERNRCLRTIGTLRTPSVSIESREQKAAERRRVKQ